MQTVQSKTFDALSLMSDKINFIGFTINEVGHSSPFSTIRTERALPKETDVKK